MKKVLFFLVSLTLVVNGFAQSKKELAERIAQQDEKIGQLEATIVEIKNTLTTMQGNLKNVSDLNSLLEKQLKFQEDINSNQSETIKQLQKDLSEAKQVNGATNSYAIITDPKNEEDSIIQLAQLYYGAKKWEDRIPLVYKPDQVKKLMPKKYPEGIKRYEVNKNETSIPGSGYKVGDRFVVKPRCGIVSLGDLYVVKTAEGFKVDWVATEQYDEITIRNYRDLKMTDKTIVHAGICNISDDYDLGDKYFNVDIDMYRALKTSIVGQRIAKLMKESPNGCVKLILEIQGKTVYNSRTDENEYYVFINRIVREDWFSE